MQAPELPNPPVEMLRLILDHVEGGVAPRFGRLVTPGRPAILTPSYVATTSRGIVPHVTQDIFQKHTSIPIVYIALEDFIEKTPQDAPIFKTSETQQQTLRSFVSLPEQCLSILGPRRLPAVPSAQPNTGSSIGISTSAGFSSLTVDDYLRATALTKPDISVGIADIFAADKISKKRVAKSADRTHAWLRDTLSIKKTGSALFASVLPVEKEQQSFYLSDLADEYAGHMQGLCLYEPESTAVVPQPLDGVVRLCLNDSGSPHEILRAITLGVDMITVPFVTSASSAGIAFNFSFGRSPKPESNASIPGKAPLGVDMWSFDYSTDVSALSWGCQCYACTRHHRAYLHHCLQAREMLAWTLFQVHNFHVIHNFFAQIRASISNGTFDEDCKNFKESYETDLPRQTGEGPRIRGYQMKSVGGGEPKKNKKAYGRLEEQARKIEEAQSGIPTPTADEDSFALETHGFAQKIEQSEQHL